MAIIAPTAVTLTGELHSQLADSPVLAKFSVDGAVTDQQAKLNVRLNWLSLAALAPYLAQAIALSIEGKLAAQAQLDWSGAADTPNLRLVLDSATLDAFELREGQGRCAQDVISLKQLSLAHLQIDVLARDIVLGSVKLVQPSVVLARDAHGRPSPQRWVHEPDLAMHWAPLPAALKAALKTAASAPSQTGNAWRVQFKDLSLDGGRITFADAALHKSGKAGADPLRFELTGLRVNVHGLEWHGGRASAPSSLQLSARIGTPKRDKAAHTGVLDYKGRVGLYPRLASDNAARPAFLGAPVRTVLRRPGQAHATARRRRLCRQCVAVPTPRGVSDVYAAGDLLLGEVHVATLLDSAAPASVDSAAMNELNSQIGASSSSSRKMVTLDLRGRAAGTALLEISDQVNPSVKPLALDIRAKATDLELAPLSTYAGKYAGFAVERGKRSREVAYKIDADGKLRCEEPGHPEPAHLRRQDRLRHRDQAAGAAHGRVAERQQWRDRHQPARQRQRQRPEIQRWRHHLEGHPEPADEGLHVTVRALGRQRWHRRPQPP